MENYENIAITINEVTKEYGVKKGIYQVNTEFEAGFLNLVVGDNGSGKSTLFKCIMGLVSYKGTITKRRLRIGYAPEEYIMPMNLTVVDFLYSIGRIKGYPREELSENVKYYLNFFDLTNCRNKLIGSLSHGMRQKVNLMQAFIHEPKIIILDEPLASLDKVIVPKVVNLIKEKAKNQLVVVSTHNPARFNVKKRRIYSFKEGILTLDKLS